MACSKQVKFPRGGARDYCRRWSINRMGLVELGEDITQVQPGQTVWISQLCKPDLKRVGSAMSVDGCDILSPCSSMTTDKAGT